MGVSSWWDAVEVVNGDIRAALGWESDDYFLYVSERGNPLSLGLQSDVYMIHKATGVAEKQPRLPVSSDEEWERVRKCAREKRRCHTEWPLGVPYDPSEDFEDWDDWDESDESDESDEPDDEVEIMLMDETYLEAEYLEYLEYERLRKLDKTEFLAHIERERLKRLSV